MQRGSKEIRVKKGTLFTVIVSGKGWYLNRFDRDKLAFKKRTVEPEHTAFIMESTGEGTGYMLLSFLSNNIYLTVVIQEYQIEGIGEEVKEKKAIVEVVEEPVAKEKIEEKEEREEIDEKVIADTGVEERKEVSQGSTFRDIPLVEELREKPRAEKAEVEEKSVTSERSAPAEKLYYINKSNEMVMIPRRDEDDIYRRGVSLYNQKNYEQARSLFSDYLSVCERCSYRDNVRIMLAECLSRSGNEEEAVTLLDAVIVSGRQAPATRALIMKADIYYRTGRIKEAAESYRKAYEMGEKDPGILEKIGDIYYLIQDYEKSLMVYEEGIAQGLKNDEILFRVASFYDQPGALRNIERAYHYYKLIVERYPGSRHYTKAEERVIFFEKNFFNYR
ncbi:MAG: tetratricopeptide repeat protein [Spirochaetota bacterium]